MLKELACLCLLGLMPAILSAQIGDSSYVLVKLFPTSRDQIDYLKQVARSPAAASSSYKAALPPLFITPISKDQEAFVLVPVSDMKQFLVRQNRNHIKFEVVQVSTLVKAALDNTFHEARVNPPTNHDSTIIESPRVQVDGVWGSWAVCPVGQFVVGMKLKAEHGQGSAVDDTALNGIRLFCSAPTGLKEIQSLEGPKGDWRQTFYCPNKQPAIGFQLRSEEPNSNEGDDTGANNLRLICKDALLEGDGQSWGEWTQPKVCLPNENVCGFRTQVQPSLGTGDDSGLLNIDMLCCDKNSSSNTQYQSRNSNVKAVDPNLIAAIIQLAEKYSAPFMESALGKLHDGIFGSGRAARSTDVAVINTLDKTFRYVGGGCEESGGWSSSLMPEHEIPPHSSVVYGAESHGLFTGCTGCRIKYKSTDGASYFEVLTSNPYVGDVSASAPNSYGLQVQTINGLGNNNVVKVILE